MALQATAPLTELYEDDETAWLETMAELIAEGRPEDLDLVHLREYLTDMAKRDRHEVEGRLKVLLTHLLKWNVQTGHRSNSWRGIIELQQMELTEDAGKGVLNDHLVSKVSDVYARAIIHASCETGLPQDAFPRKCSYTLNQLLNPDLLAGWSLRLTDD